MRGLEPMFRGIMMILPVQGVQRVGAGECLIIAAGMGCEKHRDDVWQGNRDVYRVNY